jgi:hypothetical protein
MAGFPGTPRHAAPKTIVDGGTPAKPLGVAVPLNHDPIRWDRIMISSFVWA